MTNFFAGGNREGLSEEMTFELFRRTLPREKVVFQHRNYIVTQTERTACQKSFLLRDFKGLWQRYLTHKSLN
jgi:hypothetical protein